MVIFVIPLLRHGNCDLLRCIVVDNSQHIRIVLRVLRIVILYFVFGDGVFDFIAVLEPRKFFKRILPIVRFAIAGNGCGKDLFTVCVQADRYGFRTVAVGVFFIIPNLKDIDCPHLRLILVGEGKSFGCSSLNRGSLIFFHFNFGNIVIDIVIAILKRQVLKASGPLRGLGQLYGRIRLLTVYYKLHGD